MYSMGYRVNYKYMFKVYMDFYIPYINTTLMFNMHSFILIFKLY